MDAKRTVRRGKEMTRDELAQQYYHKSYKACCWRQKQAVDDALKIKEKEVNHGDTIQTQEPR